MDAAQFQSQQWHRQQWEHINPFLVATVRRSFFLAFLFCWFAPETHLIEMGFPFISRIFPYFFFRTLSAGLAGARTYADSWDSRPSFSSLVNWEIALLWSFDGRQSKNNEKILYLSIFYSCFVFSIERTTNSITRWVKLCPLVNAMNNLSQQRNDDNCETLFRVWPERMNSFARLLSNNTQPNDS